IISPTAGTDTYALPSAYALQQYFGGRFAFNMAANQVNVGAGANQLNGNNDFFLINFYNLSQTAGKQVAKATRVLAWFVLVGWAIYPLGYIIGTPGGLFGAFGSEANNPWMDVVYNIGDAVNKIGFGLVIYTLAKSDSNQ
ncbi:MAG: hypothetical protein EBR54_07995, partial [Flavobacteriia bacterium]|nr:hypothetical protein [Flavobacteriia bacterium]